MKVYKNGVLAGSNENGYEPNTMTRTNHFLGRSNWDSDPFLDGSIAFLRMWHDEELDQDAISALFLERDMVWCPVGRYSPTGNGGCEACASGKSTNGLAATSEDTCEECVPGKYSDSSLTACTNCAPGTFNPTPGATSCQSCPEG
ncbi:hypothetical protein TeGR_g12949, partial [Tetraparma gracilis]